jgi:hypothetical protein
MNNKEILEKYGIEPIMLEMWVWDEDITKAKLKLVLVKDLSKKLKYSYITWNKYRMLGMNLNASKNNPNETKEAKVGDMGYFWDDDRAGYAYGVLDEIDNTDTYCYESNYLGTAFMNFSHKKQPWMK